jgi:hypothetical protein
MMDESAILRGFSLKKSIKCVVFDFGFTLCKDYYFNVTPPDHPEWHSVIQEQIFHEPSIVNPWLKGDLTIEDIARLVSGYIPMSVASIVATMETGCMQLQFNQAVWDFAVAQKSAGRKTALVTANMDVFSKVVAPAHRLESLFDIILNTADFHEMRKEFLWPIAFERLGSGIGYANSLLIEDGEDEPAKFRARGGLAYQYQNDELFLDWLESVQWSDQT